MHLKFIVEGGLVSYINALRRVIISDLLVPGIHRVDIQCNKTDLVPEVLAHQIGMVGVRVPKHTEPAELVMDIHNKGSLPQKIYARDLVTTKGDATIVHPDTLLGYLAPGQHLRLVAYVKWGTVREHAKWTCCHCTFSYIPSVHINQAHPLPDAGARDMQALCPTNVFDIEDGIALANRADQCTFCGECTSFAHANEGIDITVGTVAGSFLFEVESYGVFTAAEILQKATQILEQRLLTVEQRVDRDLPRLPQTPPTSPVDGLHTIMRTQCIR
jgi:DNA-directed RNA polymerase alpha subunit